MNIESIVEDFYNVPNKLRKHKNQIKMNNTNTHTMKNLTTLETLAVEGIKPFKGYGMDCTVERLEEEMWSQNGSSPSTKVLRGVLSSLIKKDVISINEGWINLL